jgi:hypothetical protein
VANHPIRNRVERSSAPGERAAVAEQDRRLASRKMLVASVEAEELTSGVNLSARTSDVSVHGCYLDTINPFSPGTRIRVHLTKGNETVHSLAVVTYAHTGLGMGVAFTEISEDSREIIQRWIADLERGNPSPKFSRSVRNPAPGISNDDRATSRVERLIQILVKKRVLTHEEARTILIELE